MQELLRMNDIRGLMAQAAKELLESPLKKTFQGEDTEFDAQDFLYQVWNSFKDSEVWGASPSLKKALVGYVRYCAEDALESFDSIIDNVDGRNHVCVADMEDFDAECYEVWKGMDLKAYDEPKAVGKAS